MNNDAVDSFDPYQRIAELYDLEHDDFRDDVDVLLQFADVVDGPILELGCGSGRIVAPLAEAGHTVVGMDVSETMLARARSRIEAAGVGDRVTLAAGDMTDAAAAPGCPFGQVVFSLNALMHLAMPDQQMRALRDASRALISRGQVIIDLVNPTPEHLVSLDATPVLEGSWTMDDGSVVDKWAFRKIVACDQVIDTTIWYDRVAPDGRFTRLRTQFDLRYLHPNELVLMLTMAGFGEIRVYGGYELDRLDDASGRLFVVASNGSSEAVN